MHCNKTDVVLYLSNLYSCLYMHFEHLQSSSLILQKEAEYHLQSQRYLFYDGTNHHVFSFPLLPENDFVSYLPDAGSQ